MNFTSSTISKLLFECEEKMYRHQHHRGAVCVSHMWDSCTIVITPLHGTLMLYMYRQKRENLENSLPQLYLLWHANQKPPSTTCVHGGGNDIACIYMCVYVYAWRECNIEVRVIRVQVQVFRRESVLR